MSKQRVCVTGASGYIASHIIEQLIQEGYQVHGTVRSLSNTERIQHLRSQFSGDLDLFEADLLQPGSFDKAVEGCFAVIHAASPFQLQVEDPIKDLVEPALQGTLNVLESVKKANISRVVVTSSVAAIVPDSEVEGKTVYNEDDWNLESKPDNSISGYRYSKRVAEEAAWKFAKENNIQLSTINPSFVLGPPLSKRTDSTSIKVVVALLQGFYKNGAGSAAYGCVDVRDVAKAHVKAMELDKAIGLRFMVTSEECYHQVDLSNIIRDIITSDIAQAAPLSENLPSTFAAPPKWKTTFDISRVRNVLNIKPRPIRESLRDMTQFLLDNELVTIPDC